MTTERHTLGGLSKLGVIIAVIADLTGIAFVSVAGISLIEAFHAETAVAVHQYGTGVVLGLVYGFGSFLAAAVALSLSRRHLSQPWRRTLQVPIIIGVFLFVCGCIALILDEFGLIKM